MLKSMSGISLEAAFDSLAESRMPMLLVGRRRGRLTAEERLVHVRGPVTDGAGEWIVAPRLSPVVIPTKYVCPKQRGVWPHHSSGITDG